MLVMSNVARYPCDHSMMRSDDLGQSHVPVGCKKICLSGAVLLSRR